MSVEARSYQPRPKAKEQPRPRGHLTIVPDAPITLGDRTAVFNDAAAYVTSEGKITDFTRTVVPDGDTKRHVANQTAVSETITMPEGDVTIAVRQTRGIIPDSGVIEVEGKTIAAPVPEGSMFDKKTKERTLPPIDDEVTIRVNDEPVATINRLDQMKIADGEGKIIEDPRKQREMIVLFDRALEAAAMQKKTAKTAK